jgi:2-phospho-L-lactate/phosphoenolpyruvate guanylyltransferase
MQSDPAAAGADATARAGVVVPIRAFAGGQARLVDAIDAAARADLGRELAARVLAAAAPFPVVVVTDAPEVREWAADAGATAVISDPGGLDASARAGLRWCRDAGLPRAIVAHADLPWARSFAGVAHDGSRPIMVVVPCHRDDGSPVLSVPTDVDFEFAYGESSFRRHVAMARRLGLAVRVVRDPDLAFDVDVPEDLVRLRRTLATPR